MKTNELKLVKVFSVLLLSTAFFACSSDDNGVQLAQWELGESIKSSNV